MKTPDVTSDVYDRVYC